MTSGTARTVANVVMASAGIAAAYVIITTPPLRRVASKALRIWLGASLPAYVVSEVRKAWVQSARAA